MSVKRISRISANAQPESVALRANSDRAGACRTVHVARSPSARPRLGSTRRQHKPLAYVSGAQQPNPAFLFFLGRSQGGGAKRAPIARVEAVADPSPVSCVTLDRRSPVQPGHGIGSRGDVVGRAFRHPGSGGRGRRVRAGYRPPGNGGGTPGHPPDRVRGAGLGGRVDGGGVGGQAAGHGCGVLAQPSHPFAAHTRTRGGGSTPAARARLSDRDGRGRSRCDRVL